MRSLLLLATVALASTAVAQNNRFDIYSGCTNYTSRGSLGVDAGEILIQVPGSHFGGVIHDAAGTGTSLVDFQYVTQDQNGSTQETYYMVVRKDASGAPDASAAGLLLRAGPLQTPASTVLTPVAWIITATLATPSTVVPLCGTYYHGMEVAAAPLWTNDGQSNHICTYYLVGGTQADNPSPPPDVVPNVAWNINYNTMAVNQPGSARAIRMALGSPAALLNMGNVDPTAAATNCVSGQGFRSWGAGGMWPSSNADGLGTRDDGLDARIKDAGSANGVYALFLSDAFACPGIPLPGLANGGLYLNFGLLTFVNAGLLDAAGQGITTIIPPGTRLGAPLLGRVIPFQGFTLGSTFTLPGKLTNVAGSSFL